jgi:excisionase family DNA binding protein
MSNLSTAQAAKLVGKHPRTIVSWIHKGMLPAVKYPGGRGAYVIRSDDLEKLVAHLYTPQPYKPKGE